MLLRRARMRKNQVMARGWRIGFLSVCVLLLVAVASCDDAKTCKASTECSAGEMCATAGNAVGPYYCLKNCDPSGECALGLAHRVEHVTQLRHVGYFEPADRRLVGGCALEARALAVGKVQAEAHGVGNGEDVREDNRGVERIARERLHRDLRCERR